MNNEKCSIKRADRNAPLANVINDSGKKLARIPQQENEL